MSSLRVRRPPGPDSALQPITSRRARFSCRRGFRSDAQGLPRRTRRFKSRYYTSSPPRPPWWKITRTLLEDFGVVELAEQLLLGRPVLRDGPTDPRRVHVVLDADVLAGDVAAPRAASEARRHRHAIGERAGIAADVRLPHHHAAHWRHQRESMDMIVVEGRDTK